MSRKKFDYIFSNFGGLNCTDDLKNIFPQFSDLLQTGGFVTLVVMPKFYPWEMLSALKGSKNAFRRFRGNGTAIVGEETIPVLYHSPGDIKSAFPENFRHISTQNIGTFYPSAHFKSLQRYENAIRFLVKLDEILNRSWMMPKGIGDYFIITFQKTC
ncbi:MAG: hypothetical protein EOO48_14255 [Flavobacterium sp.]|nr:MAG: hypothetical protein EOO48_14255 [Flavobacterium sp.]